MRRGKARILTGIPCSAIVLWLICLSAWQVHGQGLLVPPGPPGPTMKTLSQVEPRTAISSLPFTITNSGSYYLTTNLTGVASANGITVQASGVTIDLRGFVLAGVAGSLNGVTVPSAESGLSVFGGVVEGWGGIGVSGQCLWQPVQSVDPVAKFQPRPGGGHEQPGS